MLPRIWRALATRFARRRSAGRRSSAWTSCFAANISAARKTPSFSTWPSLPGPTTDVLTAVAHENKVAIVASLFERRAAGLYHNTCAVIDADGAFLGKYRKMHIPDDPLYYEKFYFTPGDLGFPTFDTKFGRIGVQICWDQWYPEGSRAVALGGAQVIFYPTSIGWHPARKGGVRRGPARCLEDNSAGHAIANGVYVAAVNRVGYEGTRRTATPGHREFWGSSFVADPFGKIVAEAAQR